MLMRESEAHAMAQNSLAPRAELVRGADAMTIECLLGLPDDGWQYELVAGWVVRMPGCGYEASSIALNLARALMAYV
jgi:hypothetical protein